MSEKQMPVLVRNLLTVQERSMPDLAAACRLTSPYP